MTPILTVRNLSTGYGKSSRPNGVPNPHLSAEGPAKAESAIRNRQSAFDIRQSCPVLPGEILLITGGNGSGKLSLLQPILQRVFTGEF